MTAMTRALAEIDAVGAESRHLLVRLSRALEMARQAAGAGREPVVAVDSVMAGLLDRTRNLVADEFGFERAFLSDAFNGMRPAPLAQARQVVMWLLHRQSLTYGVIAGLMSKDQSTIRKGCQAVEDRRDTEPDFRRRTDALLARLKQQEKEKA